MRMTGTNIVSFTIRYLTTMDYKDKVVIITGASSGIGESCALKYAELNANLVLVGRNENNLQKVQTRCAKTSGLQPLIIKADLTKEEEVGRIPKEMLEHYGKVDVLVNNAGITVFGGLLAGMSAYDMVMATNLRGPYHLTSLLVPHLEQTKGNILNVSSVLSMKPNTALLPYCMTKAALDMFTKCLALELGPKGVRVNSINPGPVKTEIFKRAGASNEDNLKLFSDLEQQLPLRKISDSEEIADLVVFLTSDKAKSITGSCYLIDCGFNIANVSPQL